MVLGALAVADDPAQIPAQLRRELVGDVRGPAHLLSGVKPGFDAFGQLHLLLGVEQGNLADLLEIRPYRVDRDAKLSVLAGLAQCLGLLLVPDETPGGLDCFQQLRRILGSALNGERDVVIRRLKRRWTSLSAFEFHLLDRRLLDRRRLRPARPLSHSAAFAGFAATLTI